MEGGAARYLHISKLRQSEGPLEEAQAWLEQGRILALPSECGYRLAVRAGSEGAARLRERWRRPLERWGAQGLSLQPHEEQLADFFWPGPLALAIRHEGGKLTLRSHHHPLTQEIQRRSPSPLWGIGLRDGRDEPICDPEVAQALLDEDCWVLSGNAPCLGLRPTRVESVSTGLRVTQVGFIALSEIRSLVDVPVQLSEEGPPPPRWLVTRPPLIAVEGELGRVRRRLRALWNSTPRAVLWASREFYHEWGERTPQQIEIAAREDYPQRLAERLEQLRADGSTYLIEGVERSSGGAEVMNWLDRHAQVICTDDPRS